MHHPVVVSLVLAVTLAAPALAQPCRAIQIGPSRLPQAMVGNPFRVQLRASGGTAPYRFALVSGTLPDGLSLTPTGVLGGTPTRRASFAFTIEAVDATGCRGSARSGLYVCWHMDVSPPSLADAFEGQPYRADLYANGVGSPTPLDATVLPPGLGLRFLGGNHSELSGTPTVAGGHGFTLSGGDEGCSFQRAYVLNVQGACGPISIDTTSLPEGRKGMPYGADIVASGGCAARGFLVTNGVLPLWMTLGPDGRLQGTPVEAGSFTFDVTVYAGTATSRTFTLTVRRAVPPQGVR